jgi:hypothetical protein
MMIQSHMRIAARVKDVSDMVAAESRIIKPPMDATPEELRFTDLVSELLNEMKRDVPNNYGSLGESLAAASSGVWFGHWVAECSLYPDSTAKYGARLEVFDINVSTIASWNRENGVMKSITQKAPGGANTIPREDLVIVTFGDPWPTGDPRLRPAVFWNEAARELMISFSEQAANAPGILVVTASNTATQAQIEKLRSLIIDFKTEAGTHAVIVGGSTGAANVQMVQPSAILDPTGYLSYYDGQLDQLMQSALSSLGLTAGSGSRALGETLRISDEEQWDASVRILMKKWGDEVIGWIARHSNYSGRLPTIERERTIPAPSPEDLLREAKELVAAGMMRNDDPRIQKLISQVYGELSVQEMVEYQPPTTPEPPATPEPEAPVVMSAKCSDGTCNHKGGSWELTDAFGQTFRSGKAQLSPLELTVMWGAWEDMRAKRDEALEVALDSATQEYRAGILDVLDNLPNDVSAVNHPEIVSLTDAARARVKDIVVEYGQGVAEDQATLVRREHTPGSSNVPSDMTQGDVKDVNDTLRQWVDEQTSYQTGQVDAAVETILSRVKGEVMAAYVINPSAIGGFTSRITPKGLAKEAAPIANRLEDVARVRESLAVADEDGLVIVEATRVHVRDANACDWCVEQDGIVNPSVGKAVFPQDLERYATSGVFDLPDPNCKGGPSECRCGVVLRYGKPS